MTCQKNWACRKVLTFASIAFALLLFLLSQVDDILLAGIVALQFVIARYVYRKVI